MKLDEYKTELLYKFFQNGLVGKEIADSLIHKGEVIVPKMRETTWIGGVRNFIEVDYHLDNAIDCKKYTFNLKEFINSQFFLESLTSHINSAEQELKKLGTQLEEKKQQLKSIKEFTL